MSWLVAAYAVFFVAIFVYTLIMARKQKELDRRIEAVRARLEEMQEKSTTVS